MNYSAMWRKLWPLDSICFHYDRDFHLLYVVLTFGFGAVLSHILTNGAGLLFVCLFSHLVVSNASWSHGPEHARPSYLLLPPGVVSNSCWLLRRHCSAISSSVVPFSSCRRTFLTSRFFPRSLLFSQQYGTSLLKVPALLPLGCQMHPPDYKDLCLLVEGGQGGGKSRHANKPYKTKRQFIACYLLLTHCSSSVLFNLRVSSSITISCFSLDCFITGFSR